MKKLILIAAISLLAACAPSGAEKVTRMNGEDDIKITDLRSVQQGPLKTVQATLQNTSWFDVDVTYRFHWVDATGYALNEESWKPLHLYAGQTTQIRGVAPAPNVADFTVELSK